MHELPIIKHQHVYVFDGQASKVEIPVTERHRSCVSFTSIRLEIR